MTICNFIYIACVAASLSNFSGTNGLVSQCVIQTTADTLYAWHCTGPHSSLTYNDCMGDFFNTSGCYYKMHFAQYRPCSQECNGVTLGAISEERCNAYCPGYLSENCKLVMAGLTTTEHISRTETDVLGKYNKMLNAHQTHDQRDLQRIVLPLTLGFRVFIVVLTAVFVLRRYTLKTRHQAQHPTTVISLSGVQEIGDEATTSLYSEQITTDVEYVSDQNHCNEMKDAY